MNDNEKGEKILRAWLKNKIDISTSTDDSFSKNDRTDSESPAASLERRKITDADVVLSADSKVASNVTTTDKEVKVNNKFETSVAEKKAISIGIKTSDKNTADTVHLKNITDILNTRSLTSKKDKTPTILKKIEETPKVDNVHIGEGIKTFVENEKVNVESAKESIDLKTAELKTSIGLRAIINEDKERSSSQNSNKNSGIKLHIFGDKGFTVKADNKVAEKVDTPTVDSKISLKYPANEVLPKQEVTSVTTSELTMEKNLVHKNGQEVNLDKNLTSIEAIETKVIENVQEEELKLNAEDNSNFEFDANNLKVNLSKDPGGLQTVIIKDTSGNTTVVREDGVTITSASGKSVSISTKDLDKDEDEDKITTVNIAKLNPTMSNVVNVKEEAVVQLDNKADKLEDKVSKELTEVEIIDRGSDVNKATVVEDVQASSIEIPKLNVKVGKTSDTKVDTKNSTDLFFRLKWK